MTGRSRLLQLLHKELSDSQKPLPLTKPLKKGKAVKRKKSSTAFYSDSIVIYLLKPFPLSDNLQVVSVCKKPVSVYLLVRQIFFFFSL